MNEYRGFDKNFSLKNKTAIITGGAKGIGKAIAMYYAEKGADIIIFDIDDTGKSIAEEIKQQTLIKTSFFKTDVTQKTDIQNSLNDVLKDYKKIDVLVNSAGVVFLNDAEKLSEKDWDNTIDTNQKGVFLLSQIVGNKMIEWGGGKIINIASQAGVIALEGHIAYCATKAAVIAMTKVWALEWAKYGINVNAISPTVVLTELGEKAWAGEKGEKMKELIPVGRFAYPDEIAAVAVFLASDASSMINGENIIIDGGYTIK